MDAVSKREAEAVVTKHNNNKNGYRKAYLSKLSPTPALLLGVGMKSLTSSQASSSFTKYSKNLVRISKVCNRNSEPLFLMLYG